MTGEPSGERCGVDGGHCITCGDDGVPMRVLEVQDELANCQDEETEETHKVAVDLVGPVATGDRVLVHAGVAIGRLESSEPVGARR